MTDQIGNRTRDRSSRSGATGPQGPAQGLPPAAPSHARVRVAFLIRSLGRGGAERQLVTLASAMDRDAFEVVVYTFYGGGPLQADLEAADVRVVSMDKRGRWDLFRLLRDLTRNLRAFRPHVLHAYNGSPNMVAAILRPFLPGTRIVWGVRCADMDLSQYDWVSRLGARVESRLSRFADLIISNSEAGRSHCITRGFPGEHIEVIPNGIRTDVYHPDPEGRRRIREEWNVPDGAPLIGLVARLDPMKNHASFLRAAAWISKREPAVRFVCVGDGPASYAVTLRAEADSLGLSDRLVWAGARTDLSAVYSALDIATLTSITEGFPNVVAEAMACDRRCVVTSVGDAAWLVGSTGIAVPPRDDEALAHAWSEMLNGRGFDRTASPRERVCTLFSVDSLKTSTETTLLRVLGGRT